jgi:hypothetical protein
VNFGQSLVASPDPDAYPSGAVATTPGNFIIDTTIHKKTAGQCPAVL